MNDESEVLSLGQIFDDLPAEIYIFDAETLVFIKISRGAIKNAGYSQVEFATMTPLDLLPDFNEASFAALLEPLLSGARACLEYETTHRRKDLTTYPVQVHMQPCQIARRSSFVMSVTDITERMRLEEELMHAKKMESIGQLAAGIAHEINTPAQFVGDNTRFLKDSFQDMLTLNKAYEAVLVAARAGSVPQALLDQTDAAVEAADPEFLSEEIPPAIEQSLEGISRISHIVRAMKEFSHPGGKERERINLNKAIETTITVATNEWRYIADIETDLQEDLPPVSCTPQDITQVILNLIVNASHAIADAMTDQPGQKGLIRIVTKQDDDCVEIQVSDSGCGIPEEIRERIFDAFFTTKAVGKGTGQGLSMAYTTIVDKHAGTLRLKSEVGQGTTFIIRLPLDQPDLETEPDLHMAQEKEDAAV